MWVMHPDGGFYSAVESKDDPNVLVVRTRARKDAKALAKLVPSGPKVIAGGGTDYPYRLRLTRAEWAAALVQLSERIDYGNFKDAVKDRQGEHRAGVYSRIWGALLALERERPRRRRRGEHERDGFVIREHDQLWGDYGDVFPDA